MKFFKTSTLFLASALLLSACGGGAKNDGKKEGGKDDKKKEKKEKKVSIYNYKNANTQVSITTYKHTAKNGVGIDFDTLSVSGVGTDSKKISDLFEGAKFTVPISGLNSGNPDRDKKIREHFFGTMKKTKAIKGSIEKMKLDGKEGKATLAIKMNGKSQNVKMDLERKKQKLKMTGEIDAKNWDGQDALDALQKACEEKHTGEDGKTKLWSTVTLNISTKLDLKERMAS
jgi:hypothetical protein